MCKGTQLQFYGPSLSEVAFPSAMGGKPSTALWPIATLCTPHTYGVAPKLGKRPITNDDVPMWIIMGWPPGLEEPDPDTPPVALRTTRWKDGDEQR